jgi:dTMP kinase
MAYLIVIEGTDGCGKQTQAGLLYDRLVGLGYNVMRQSFPNYDCDGCIPVKMYLGGEFGDSAECMDAYQASVLFSVDRLTTYKKYLEDFCKTDGVLILDRYMQSNMLHQAGKLDDWEKVDNYVDWLVDLECNKLGLPRANKVIFLDVPPDVSRQLIASRGIHKSDTKKDVHEDDSSHLDKAYRAGKYVSKICKWDTIECTENGNLKSIEDISELVWQAVSEDLMK